MTIYDALGRARIGSDAASYTYFFEGEEREAKNGDRLPVMWHPEFVTANLPNCRTRLATLQPTVEELLEKL